MTGATPAHWIRPNEVSRQPKVWVYLDTEAIQTPTGAGEVQTWRLGVTCLDRRKRGHDEWADPEWAVHRTPEELWHWIDCRARPRERVIVLAHNLAYDLRIAQAFRILPARGWTLDRIRPDGEQTFARWRNGARTLVMVDTTAWWPTSLAVLGDELGIAKPDLPSSDHSQAAWIDRCVADVTILRTAWRSTIGWLAAGDLGTWQPTGASQAWSAWRHRFLSDKVLVGENDELRELERSAVYCGRSEAWRHGRFTDGPYTEWDVESCYLRIMRDCRVPVRPLARVENPSESDVARWLGVSCLLATVTVDTDEPVAPVHTADGIVWPVGRYRTTVWEPELRLLRAHARNVAVDAVTVYKSAPALADFARWLAPIIAGRGAGVDPVIRRVAKHWSRAIVGRFGVRYHTWEPFGESPAVDVSMMPMVDAQSGARTRLLTIGDVCMIETGLVEGDNAVPSIMGWIMAETRRRLWVTMRRAGLDHVLHVDTDGLLVDPEGSDELVAHGNAGLRIKGVFDTVEVIGPRQVVYGGQLRAPGVPRRSKRVGDREWSGTVWQGLARSLNEATADRVIVAPRTVTLKGTDRRRVHLDGGRTGPVELAGA